MDYLDGKDVNFETSSSARLDTIKLYYLHNIAAHSLALVFASHYSYDDTRDSERHFSIMLKKSLKVERVHTYINLSFSQMKEKTTWVIEKTTSNLDRVDSKKSPYFVVIANCSHAGLFAESQPIHRSGTDNSFDDVNSEHPQNIVPDSVDLTRHYNNF